jgi:hypothetical protein
MPAADYPHLIKHVALAIYRSDYLQGSKERKMIAALDIAISKLIEWGHLHPRSLYGPPFVLTAKGRKRESVHNSENPRKSVKFDHLYHLVEAAYEGREVKVEQAEELNNRVARKRAKQARKAYVAASAAAPNVRTKVARIRPARPKRAAVRRAKRR